MPDNKSEVPSPAAMTKPVPMGSAMMTDEQQKAVSEKLKAEGSAGSGEKTYKVTVRTPVPGGRFRGGVHVTEEEKTVNVTATQLAMLQADRAIIVEGEGIPARDKSAKWPPEGLTPERSPQMRAMAALDAPPDAMDSTGKMLDGSPRPVVGDPNHDDREPGEERAPSKGRRG